MKVVDNSLKSGSTTIPWRIFSPESDNKEYCVLWLNGWSSAMDTHSEALERLARKTDICFATLDIAGHGRNNAMPLEKTTNKQQFSEVIAIYDELSKIGYKKVIVIGVSHGGYLAAMLAGERPVHAAILRCPAIYANRDFDIPTDETGFIDDYWNYVQDMGSEKVLRNNKACASIKDFNGYVYVLEHELDEVIPKVVPQTYFNLAKHGNYILVPGTKHSPKVMGNPKLHTDYIEHIVVSIVKAIKLQDKIPHE